MNKFNVANLLIFEYYSNELTIIWSHFADVPPLEDMTDLINTIEAVRAGKSQQDTFSTFSTDNPASQAATKNIKEEQACQSSVREHAYSWVTVIIP